MGEITDRVIAYRDGQVSLEALCTYLATFNYRACPPLGWWQTWGGGHALDGTVQELLGSAARLLTDDEYRTVMKAIKSRWHSIHERGKPRSE